MPIAIAVVLAACAGLATLLHVDALRFCMIEVPVATGRLLVPGLKPGVAWIVGNLALCGTLLAIGWAVLARSRRVGRPPSRRPRSSSRSASS